MRAVLAAYAWQDRAGDIDIEEMRRGLAKTFQRPFHRQEAEQIFAAIDYDKSGDISREEWNERFERNVRQAVQQAGKPSDIQALKFGIGSEKCKSISHGNQKAGRSFNKWLQGASGSAAAGGDAGAQNSEPSPWREAVDPSTGKTYYYHEETRETSWTKPKEVGNEGGGGSDGGERKQAPAEASQPDPERVYRHFLRLRELMREEIIG